MIICVISTDQSISNNISSIRQRIAYQSQFHQQFHEEKLLEYHISE